VAALVGSKIESLSPVPPTKAKINFLACLLFDNSAQRRDAKVWQIETKEREQK